MSHKTILIAASGTGGHLFPALAVAEQLKSSEIEWLGVPDRLETTLVGHRYPLNTISIEGFQKPFGLKTLKILSKQIASVFQVRKLIKEKQIKGIFTTGGYIAAPAIIAARLEKIPVILHEANFIPGKVTRLLSPLCEAIALGFAGSAQYFSKQETLWVSTPVREQFLTLQTLDLPIDPEAFLILVVGGSQGAVAINQIVRRCAKNWLEKGATIVHLTGNNDPEKDSLSHPRYFSLPFYEQMAGLLQRANLAISRAGAGTLTELAVTKTPAILIPYPYAAENHQAYNAKVFSDAGAALVYEQKDLTPELLEAKVLELWKDPDKLAHMSHKARDLAVTDSAQRLAKLLVEKLSDPKVSTGCMM